MLRYSFIVDGVSSSQKYHATHADVLNSIIFLCPTSGTPRRQIPPPSAITGLFYQKAFPVHSNNPYYWDIHGFAFISCTGEGLVDLVQPNINENLRYEVLVGAMNTKGS